MPIIEGLELPIERVKVSGPAVDALENRKERDGRMIEAKVNMNVLYVKGCFPHYRRPLGEIIELRKAIHKSLLDREVKLPLEGECHLRIAARRHYDGGDLSNIMQAVCQAIDGNTLDKSTAILHDDGQLISIHARWIR